MTSRRQEPDAILAAGGILMGDGEMAGKIALVRRRRYGGEVGLPKGKAHPDEGLRTTALREVKEETGYDTEIVDHAGTTRYMVGPRPKAVSYFRMRLSGPAAPAAVDSEEIDRVEWVTPHEALALLTHAEDRRLVSGVFGLRTEERA